MGRIVPAEHHKEATESYMAYAIIALLGPPPPDARDGGEVGPSEDSVRNLILSLVFSVLRF